MKQRKDHKSNYQNQQREREKLESNQETTIMPEFVDTSISTDVQLFPNEYALVKKRQTLPATKEAADLIIKEFPSPPVNGSFWVILSQGNILFDYKLDVAKTVEQKTNVITQSSISQLLSKNLDKPLILEVENTKVNPNARDYQKVVDLECTVLRVTGDLVIVKVGDEIMSESLNRIQGIRGANLQYMETQTTNNTTNTQSIKINQVGPGGSFDLQQIVQAAAYDICQSVSIDQKESSFKLTNKMTIKCLSKGFENCNSLKIMGHSKMTTNQTDSLFSDSISKYLYDKSGGVDQDKLFQEVTVSTELAKLFQDIKDIALILFETQAVTLLDNITGTYQSVYLFNTSEVRKGKVPGARALKFKNDSNQALMKGNLLLTDSDGLQVAQSFVPETAKSEFCYVRLGYTYNLDCTLNTSMSKNQTETKTEITKSQSAIIKIINNTSEDVTVQLEHEVNGTVTTTTPAPTEIHTFLEEGQLNQTNKLKWVIVVKASSPISLQVDQSKVSKKPKKKKKNQNLRGNSESEDDDSDEANQCYGEGEEE